MSKTRALREVLVKIDECRQIHRWKNGKLLEVKVRSLSGGSVQLRGGAAAYDVKLAKGKTYHSNGQ